MQYRSLALVLLFGIPILAKAQTANRFDVVITEIMADPTPPVNLPNAEYIEIKNMSSTAYNLNGWKLADSSSAGTINTSFILQPDSIAILCSTGNVATFSTYGRAIGVTSFPSLDNDGDLLSLRSSQGKTIHAVSYSLDWYGNEIKKDGGWSLEMIDPKDPCGGKDNWRASTDANGGTPGKKNSVDGVNNDTDAPQLTRSYSMDNTSIVLLFDEPLDSLTATIATNY
ncbi:MAG: lamin tail domain-containing protein, partial [Flavisolibacter sp.]